MAVLLEAKNIVATVPLGGKRYLTTVDNFSYSFEEGFSYSIVGKSGSGKTSLLSILGLLNKSYKGELIWGKQDVRKLNDREKSRLRAKEIGFVFQNYSLIPHLKVWENLEIVLRYGNDKRSKSEQYQAILEALNLVGLEGKERQYPPHLSGGEQQRCALARALVSEPKVLMCDEPTGALDTKTGEMLMDYLLKKVREKNLSLILVTHDKDIAKSCDTQLEIQEGRLVDVISHSQRP